MRTDEDPEPVFVPHPQSAGARMWLGYHPSPGCLLGDTGEMEPLIVISLAAIYAAQPTTVRLDSPRSSTPSQLEL
jgi:hypothetical protein